MIRVGGLTGAADPFFISSLYQLTDLSIVIFTHSNEDSENLRDLLTVYCPDASLCYFPSPDTRPYDDQPVAGHLLEQQSSCLHQLLQGKRHILITSWQTLSYSLPFPDEFQKSCIFVEPGRHLRLETLTQWLIQIGFQRTTMVEGLGEFSVRGEILDIFPYLTDNPLRIVFYHEEIESIKMFDIFSQRSISKILKFTIIPLRPFVLDEPEITRALNAMREKFPQALEDYQRLEHDLLSQTPESSWGKILPFLKNRRTILLEYISTECILLARGWEDMLVSAEQLDNEIQQTYHEQLNSKRIVAEPDPLVDTLKSLEKDSQKRMIKLNDGPRELATSDLYFQMTEIPSVQGNLQLFKQGLSNYLDQGYQMFLYCDNSGQKERMEEILSEHQIEIPVLVGPLSAGFVFHDSRSVLFSERQLFGRRTQVYRYVKYKGGTPIASLAAMTHGDFVVHEDHGIAQFNKIEGILVEGHTQDCLELQFSEGDKLYVPIDDLNKIRKFSGKEGAVPTLTRLGTHSWEKLKERTRKAIMEMAQELIGLYAQRKYYKRSRYSMDSHWQQEFDSSFLYQETGDQQRTIQEIKRDLENETPMDRLVCGDVGFGKTEVAARAAFKVMISGKQVCILVPTTILAQQHFLTFKDRFSEFPAKIEMISRFKTKKEQQEILGKALLGKIDILIGTHRLFSRDLQFKDLGLLIIDEEHRFGVRQKEKLKKLKALVDVLSLTATPIPRTLHMSLSGARDMSIIATPPKNRLPIKTRVLEFNEGIIRDSIQRELERSGQVFFVHNRVESIKSMASYLERLVPQGKIGIAHGQMNEHDLESIMFDFLNRKIDVLVSTAIIESGLDIPNVNTIIINRADRFGLAQLYQLRGRVGRTHIQGYAFLLCPPLQLLKPITLKRLKALEQFTELGSGFQIAMRDLEIRGAGNILGSQQHGFINAVGFDLYTKMLQEAVQKIKGQKSELLLDVKVKINISAGIPESYITGDSQRVLIYQRLLELSSLDQIQDLTEELVDRFGEMPLATHNLFDLMIIKVLARKFDIETVALESLRLKLILKENSAEALDKIKDLIGRKDLNVEIKSDEKLVILIELQKIDLHEELSQIKKILQVSDE